MLLVVFDFDHTIIDQNSDLEINELFPSISDLKNAEKTSSQHECWTFRMQSMFDQLRKYNISDEDYRRTMKRIPMTEGFPSLIEFLSSLENCQLIIASDSNSFFIETILENHRLEKKFSKIFTNPARFDFEQNRLIVEPLGQKTCSTCPMNMCKKEIIENYRKTINDENLRILFIGDGHNDVCAAKSLGKNDFVFARAAYRMAKELDALIASNSNSFLPTLFQWKNGEQIERFIREKILQNSTSD